MCLIIAHNYLSKNVCDEPMMLSIALDCFNDMCAWFGLRLTAFCTSTVCNVMSSTGHSILYNLIIITIANSQEISFQFECRHNWTFFLSSNIDQHMFKHQTKKKQHHTHFILHATQLCIFRDGKERDERYTSCCRR